VSGRSGSVSVPVLILLVTLSLLGGGLVLLSQGLTGLLARSRERLTGRNELLSAAEQATAAFCSGKAYGPDSPLDPVFAEVRGTGGFDVVLEDISSFIGINWARKGLLEETGLLLEGARSADALQQHREDTGLHMDIQQSYGRFFRAGVRLDEVFTAYSGFNINVADEFALRKLYAVRTGDAAKAELFHVKVHNYRLQTEEKEWIQPERLEVFLGTDFEVLFPVVTAVPPINVNFAPSAVLEAVLAACGVSDAEQKIRSLEQARDSRPLNTKALEFIMGDDYQETPVGQYLGATTWFWRLQVSGAAGRLVWILARLPDEQTELVRLRLIEERYSP